MAAFPPPICVFRLVDFSTDKFHTQFKQLTFLCFTRTHSSPAQRRPGQSLQSSRDPKWVSPFFSFKFFFPPASKTFFSPGQTFPFRKVGSFPAWCFFFFFFFSLSQSLSFFSSRPLLTTPVSRTVLLIVFLPFFLGPPFWLFLPCSRDGPFGRPRVRPSTTPFYPPFFKFFFSSSGPCSKIFV